jgi:hypothetical protein
MNTIHFLRAMSLSSLLALAFVAPACGPQDSTGVGNPGLSQDEQALVNDGNESSESGDTASSLVAAPVFAITKPSELDTVDSATTVASLSRTVFLPSGCATADRVGAVVTYTFADCSGPLGLLHLKGTIIATFSAGAPGSVSVHVQSESLTLNDVPVEETADATISFSGSTKITHWTGLFKGTTPRGFPVTHTATYDIQSDTSTSCIQIDGNASTTIRRDGADHGIKTSVTGYVRCGKRTACPTSGTFVFSTLDDKIKLTVTVVPGGHIEITTPRGKVKDYPLACG